MKLKNILNFKNKLAFTRIKYILRMALSKMFIQAFLTVVFVVLGIFFIKNEHAEVREVIKTLGESNAVWVVIGIIVSVIYILLQAWMYVLSFRSINKNIHIGHATLMFLKRNFISVFLPAGGISSLAFFTSDAEKSGTTRTEIHIASSIYAVCGIFSVFVVAVPALLYTLVRHSISSNEIYGFLGLTALTVLAVFFIVNVIKKGFIYRMIIKYNPDFEIILSEIKDNRFSRKNFIYTNLISILIEFAGIAHLYIAMKAFNFDASLEAAILGYIVATMFLIASPFMRGLGAIEFSLSYILIQYGFPTIPAISITFLYRFFEFWLPLVIGLFSFLFNRNSFILRIFPAIFILLLGGVNILSVMLPVIHSRMRVLRHFIPLEAIHASYYFVLLSGVMLLIISVFMLKAYRSAWIIGLALSVVSLIGHLTKGIDYEEAILAFFVIVSLLYTRKQYYKNGNRKFQLFGVQTAVVSIVVVLIYGIIGFYFIKARHFGNDFTAADAIFTTIRYYFLVGSDRFLPQTKFAREFVYSIQILGAVSMSFLFYSLIRPWLIKLEPEKEDFDKAKILVEQYGDSPLDYFKTYFDKQLFFGSSGDSFLAYRVSQGFAVILGKPVSANLDEMKKIIHEFDNFCKNNDLRSIYYRVDESYKQFFTDLGKKSLLIGQEAIVNVGEFTMEGGQRKSLRNAVNNLKKKKYALKIYNPPIKTGLIQKLKAVSDEWLHDEEYEEIIFSQGIFDESELKTQTIITIEDPDEKVIAFLNIVPDYVKGEGTYDLIRKTKDAPGGALDFLLIEMFDYFKSIGINHVNIGLVPMSGITEAKTVAEYTIKFAYENIKQFGQYKGMRSFKDKFAPCWINKYLIFDNMYDLLQIPSALNKVVKI